MSGTSELRIEVAWFANGGEEGKPALGTPETLAWTDLVSIIADNRRIGEKDGCDLIPVRFERESGRPRVVRRKAVNARARTAIVLDIEENKATGELPPDPVTDSVHRLNALQLASVVWTTHSHTAERPRYRVMVPLDSEIAPDLPAGGDPGTAARRQWCDRPQQARARIVVLHSQCRQLRGSGRPRNTCRYRRALRRCADGEGGGRSTGRATGRAGPHRRRGPCRRSGTAGGPQCGWVRSRRQPDREATSAARPHVRADGTRL